MNNRNIYITLIIFFLIIVFIILYFLFFDNNDNNNFIELFADTDKSNAAMQDKIKSNKNAYMLENIKKLRNSNIIANIQKTSENDLDNELKDIIKMNNEDENINEIKNINENVIDSIREEYNINSIVNTKDQKDLIPEEYKCNLETDDGIKEYSTEYIKNAPCNYSIHKKFMYGCKQLSPFSINETNSYIKDLLDDPSQYYKKLYKPIVANLENIDFIGSNMPEYSNYSKITDIGKIKLNLKKPQPLPQNYVFKNSPAFNFN